MSEEGFYKYLRSISVERCESVPELSGSHVPVLRAPLKCRLRVYQLSPVRSRAPGKGRLDRYRRSGKLLLMSVLFWNAGLMSLSSTLSQPSEVRTFTLEKNQFSGRNINPTHSRQRFGFYPNAITQESEREGAQKMVHIMPLFSPEISRFIAPLSLAVLFNTSLKSTREFCSEVLSSWQRLSSESNIPIPQQ